MTTPPTFAQQLQQQLALAEDKLAVAEAAAGRARAARDELRGAMHMLSQIASMQAEAPNQPLAETSPEEPTITTGSE